MSPGETADLILAASSLNGEMRRILLAAGIVLLILVLSWGLEEWRLHHPKRPHHHLSPLVLSIGAMWAVSLLAMAWLAR